MTVRLLHFGGFCALCHHGAQAHLSTRNMPIPCCGSPSRYWDPETDDLNADGRATTSGNVCGCRAAFQEVAA